MDDDWPAHDYSRDENGIPCTCAEDRAWGDPELHSGTCAWANAQLSKRGGDYTTEEIAEALSEARAECYREPGTNLWKSFWDRLTQGGPIPEDPLEKVTT